MSTPADVPPPPAQPDPPTPREPATPGEPWVAPPPPAPPIDRDDVRGPVRVDDRLRSLFAGNPQGRARVAVRFSTLPDDAELGRLGLAATGANPDVGSVNAAQFAALQARPDVVSIAAEPDDELSPPYPTFPKDLDS